VNPAKFEVLSNGEIKGPLSFSGIQRGVREGQFRVEDSYRRKGSTEWRSLRKALSRNRLFETIFFGAYSIGLCLAGLWLIWQGLRSIGLESDSSSWPSVNGRITYAQVENCGHNRFQYMPRVGYIYQVGTKRRFGDTIYPECTIGGRMQWAQSVIARHPAESACLVYYSPTNPRRTTLEPGLAPHSFTFAGVGLMLVYTGMLLGFLALRIWRKPFNERTSRASAFRDVFLSATAIIGFIFVFWLP
jgi:hypothetical protein